MKISGESLFNDGVAVVVFITLYEIIKVGYDNASALQIGWLFLKETGGGLLFGLRFGYIGCWALIKAEQIDKYLIDIYNDKRLHPGFDNLIKAHYTDFYDTVLLAALFSLGLFFAAWRTQTPISDVQYMKAMIPHHSSAIMVSKHADIKDAEVKKLSEKIIKSQEEEIAQMEAILKKMKKYLCS